MGFKLVVPLLLVDAAVGLDLHSRLKWMLGLASGTHEALV